MIKEIKPRITISINKDILQGVDDYANLNGLSRAGAISVLVMNSLNAQRGLERLSELKDTLKQMQDLAELQDRGNLPPISNRG